jgi:hypothetical protein
MRLLIDFLIAIQEISLELWSLRDVSQDTVWS